MLCAFGVSAFAEPPRVLLTSPQGTYRVEQPTGEDIPTSQSELENVAEFIVKVSNPERRAPIPRADAQPLYDFAFSPDERWFAVNVHYGSKMAGFRLYELKEGPKLERVLEEESAWKWLDDNKFVGLSAADMMLAFAPLHAGWR